MTRLVFKIIVQSCYFCEGRDQILHPSRQEREGFFVQGVLRRVAETNSVTADVESQEAGHICDLVLGGSFDELVGQARV